MMALKSQKESRSRWSRVLLPDSRAATERPRPQPWEQMEMGGAEPLPIQGLWASLEEAISWDCFSFLSFILSFRFERGCLEKTLGGWSTWW